jgi:signal transduction histidine kinase
VKFSDGQLTTDVEDSGIGISSEDLEKLFKFFGALTKTRDINRGGMGLGLTISKMILHQLKGNISVKSEP